MMAFHYIVEQQVMYHQEIPLLSASDIKLRIAQNLIQKMDQEPLMELVHIRHRKRQADINRFYKE